MAGLVNRSARRKIDNTLVMLAYLLDIISPDHHRRQRLGRLLARHEIDTRHMGFPNDWQGMAFWSTAVEAMQEEGAQ